ncbi:ubiquinone/menaquinone biosynthesis methyltransferase [bacterium]|nr:ubiquinone/menaquinone biosynthesis methyltransferase [bacterium]
MSFSTGSEKRAAVQGMFAAISHRYDLLNRMLSLGMDRRWRKRAVSMFSEDVASVLDVAAGTGDLSAAWLAHRRDARVLATDFVPEMCRLGAGKLAGESRLSGYAAADALALPFADGSFDGAMAAFGVRNFADLGAGLTEMARVIRPGGEILILEFFPSRNALQDKLFRFYFHQILPRLGGWISGDREAYAYLPRSVGEFVSREAFEELCATIGLNTEQRIEFSGGIATAVLVKKTSFSTKH